MLDPPVTGSVINPMQSEPLRTNGAVKMKRLCTTLTALAVAVAVAVSGIASAHSKKEKTVPADGAVLSASPSSIGMTFDMPMRVTMIKLTNSDGDEHEVIRTDNMAPLTDFAASPESLEPGQYTVEWRGLAEDGHAMEGSFSFKVEN
ncbi:MAG: copper resistance CopC family protein [Pseudomonadota bacterium]